MAETKPAASGSGGGRKNWDKSEWEAKAKAKDEEYAEQAKANDEALKQGKRPQRRKEDLPEPTQALQARTEDLGLEKNLNKTMLVQTSTTGKGPKGAGFYCDMCNRTFQDSLSYLDHVNGRLHLRRLGQTTQVTRSTLAQVREKIRQLREATANKVTAKNYDFAARLAQVRQAEADEKQRRKEEKKRKREERKEEEQLGRIGIVKRSKVDEDESRVNAGQNGGMVNGQKGGRTKSGGKEGRGKEQKRDGEGDGDDKEVEAAQREHEDMAAMMGFGGFGGQKKR